MKKLTDHCKWSEWDETETLIRLVRCWCPSSFERSEGALEEELYAHLITQLPDVAMTRQYGIAKGRADIVIEDKHVIELKLGFTDVAEFDRCLGQLERYRQKWVDKDRGIVYLVVVGESDVEFRSIMHTWLERTNAPYFAKQFHLIEKREATQPS